MTLTYTEVGATRDGDLPDGYRHVRRRVTIGSGRAAFAGAAQALRRWDMHRGTGLRVARDTPAPAVGLRMVSWAGPLKVPCEVVWVVDEPDRYGFGYGTLPGHPESGEEAFEVYLDEAATLWCHIRAFSRPARWFTRAAGPLTHVAQDLATNGYVRALRRAAGG